MTAAFPQGRPRALALVAFLALFVGVTTAILASLQTRVSPPRQDLLLRSAELHALVSDSLVLAGLHPGELLLEETERRGDGRGAWNGYRTEILVGGSFPVDDWIAGLGITLGGEGARLEHSRSGSETNLRVTYGPSGGGEILVESVMVRMRPTPESLIPERVSGTARAAIVIDDLGQNPAHLSRLADLGIPITLSVLPGLPHSRAIAEKARRNSMEVFLHLPMEPVGFPEKQPGPGALLAEMTDEEISRLLQESFAAVPGVAGVNNHMGSLLTTDARAMNIVMKELKARNLLFLDSKTSPDSLAFETAYRHNLPAARRDIFLDAHDDEEFIRGQVRELLLLAKERGNAIGIGHPYRSTLKVLEEMRDEIVASGIEWVTVSSLAVQAYRPGEDTETPSGGKSR